MANSDKDQLLQNLWREGKWPILNGIVSHGRYMHADVRMLGDGFNISGVYETDMEIDPVCVDEGIDPYCSAETPSGIIYAGGGAHGNVGFIAYESPKGMLDWLLYSENSNEFVKISVDQDTAIAVNNCGCKMRLSLIDPVGSLAG